MPDRPLLMIPGPIEVSPRVLAAFSAPPPSHLEARLMTAFRRALGNMRRVWGAAPSSQPFVVAGSGTLAMEMTAANLIEPGDRALLVNTGFFSQRMGEMLRRLGAEVTEVRAPVGDTPSPESVAAALAAKPEGSWKALFATHVDTSTGVRLDPGPLAGIAADHGALAVFDGVCATAGEPFDMAALGADVYLTASQKALGLPPGIALLVASERALAAREARRSAPPPYYLDWLSWLPVHRAYEEGKPAYFATPATSHLLALDAGLEEILEEGMAAHLAAQERAGRAMQAAWEALGLEPVPVRRELRASTLSALYFPPGVDAALVARIGERGVAVAGGLHPEIRGRYFRVGHMGYVVRRPDLLRRTVEAVAGGLQDLGRTADGAGAWAAAEAVLGA
ncbi:MAG TPA: alanine--glyoxylate aminotransferase family protein [Thermoanaerobaculia bacterium]